MMTEMNRETIMVTRTSLPPFEEYEAMIRRLWDTHYITNMGMYHEELKEKLKEYLGVRETELFVNGHMALELLLQAEELRGEVITTPFTFASTVHAICRNGLTPVMCDVCETDGTINADEIERHITKNTCAIVPVHVYGRVCDDEKIESIAAAYGLRVYYDAAHAFGETIGKPDGSTVSVASLGNASMLSFHATKVFHTIEGGAVVWNPDREPGLGDVLYKIKNFGITGKENVAYIGSNAKLNEFSAAMGLCNLRHIEEWIAARAAAAARYRENLKGAAGVRIPAERPEVRSNHAYMPVILDPVKYSRDEVYERMCAAGIFPRKYFYPLATEYECYRGRFDTEALSVARYFSEHVLTLPIYPELAPEEIDRICEILTEKRGTAIYM